MEPKQNERPLLGKAGLVGVTAASALALSACNLDSETAVYTSDLKEIHESGESLTAASDVRIQVPSEDQCDENRDKIEGMLGDHLLEFEVGDCGRDGMEAYLNASARIAVVPFTPGEGVPEALDSLLALGVEGIEQDGGDTAYRIHFLIDEGKLGQLNNAVENEYYQSINIAASQNGVEINNDERGDWRMSVISAFVGGNPVIDGEHTLARRDRVSIRPSDVVQAHLARHATAPVVTIQPAD